MKTLGKNRLKVWLFQKALALAARLGNAPNAITPAPFRLIQIGSAFWLSRALYCAAVLSIADHLNDKGRTTSELAIELNLNEDNLYRLLRMLASNGIFKEMGNQRFFNTSLSDCLRVDHPQCVRDMILMHNSKEMSQPWYENLESAMRDGDVPFALSNGAQLFDYMNSHPQFDALFSKAMTSVDSVVGTDYLEDFNWNAFDKVIDVGGSRGNKSVDILSRQTKLKALVFDREQVIVEAKKYWRVEENNPALERIDFVGGDMLDNIPAAENGKNIFMFYAIFHGMGDEDAQTILSNLHCAVGDTGASALIVDAVAEESQINPMIASMDMQMLMGTKGRERTETEWRKLFSLSGFGIKEIVSVRGIQKFIVIQALT